MGGKCVKLCTVHVSVCVGEECSGGKCVKLCTVHVSVPPPHTHTVVGESVLNCVLHM